MSRARLKFESGGGRTYLEEQFVPYPFHITRPLYINRSQPDLATLLLQSCAGGLYSEDQLGLDIALGDDTAANVTTQSSTIVHDGRGLKSVYDTSVHVGQRSFFALTPEPAILFPGSQYENKVDVFLADEAIGVISDGFLTHDPDGKSGTFQHFLTRTRVYDDHGCLLLSDQQELGTNSAAFAMGDNACLGNAIIFGKIEESMSCADLETKLKAVGCLAGASLAPNNLGIGIRLLAPDGVSFRAGLEVIRKEAYREALGFIPTLSYK